MEWKISHEPVDYQEAVAAMETRVQGIISGEEDELVWLLEHPSLYTAGSSAKAADLLDNLGFPVYHTGRGGQYTYHGPGQRIAYVMLDLKKHTPDVRVFVKQLEACIIMTLAAFNIKGEIREDRVGVWVASDKWQVGHETSHKEKGARAKGEHLPSIITNPAEAKIAALGIRIKRWVSYHGIAININPDLSHYSGIIPCGIREYGVTSFAALGVTVTASELDEQFIKSFQAVFALQPGGV